MATSTELLRAAEHMRQHGERLLANEQWHAGTSYCEAADELEVEAKRLQAVEAQRSWPKGWPPFAVLRRAYRLTDMHHRPSTRLLERYSSAQGRYSRKLWSQALSMTISDPSSP